MNFPSSEIHENRANYNNMEKQMEIDESMN